MINQDNKQDIVSPTYEKLRKIYCTKPPPDYSLDTFINKFGKLMDFAKENGHCNVPETHELSVWVNDLKYRYHERKDSFYSCEIDMLNEINFDWD